MNCLSLCAPQCPDKIPDYELPLSVCPTVPGQVLLPVVQVPDPAMQGVNGPRGDVAPDEHLQQLHAGGHLQWNHPGQVRALLPLPVP